jgi:hypothetical protein
MTGCLIGSPTGQETPNYRAISSLPPSARLAHHSSNPPRRWPMVTVVADACDLISSTSQPRHSASRSRTSACNLRSACIPASGRFCLPRHRLPRYAPPNGLAFAPVAPNRINDIQLDRLSNWAGDPNLAAAKLAATLLGSGLLSCSTSDGTLTAPLRRQACGVRRASV